MHNSVATVFFGRVIFCLIAIVIAFVVVDSAVNFWIAGCSIKFMLIDSAVDFAYMSSAFIFSISDIADSVTFVNTAIIFIILRCSLGLVFLILTENSPLNNPQSPSGGDGGLGRCRKSSNGGRIGFHVR